MELLISYIMNEKQCSEAKATDVAYKVMYEVITKHFDDEEDI